VLGLKIQPISAAPHRKLVQGYAHHLRCCAKMDKPAAMNANPASTLNPGAARRFWHAPLERALSHHCIGCLTMVFHFAGAAFRMSLK
jgi:hypothetical protein